MRITLNKESIDLAGQTIEIDDDFCKCMDIPSCKEALILDMSEDEYWIEFRKGGTKIRKDIQISDCKVIELKSSLSKWVN